VSAADGLREVALDLARSAANLIRERSEHGLEVAETKSSEVDIVTATDLAAEALIRRRLRELRPDDAVIGEEGADLVGTTGVRWIIDPIDGTVNFVYGLPEYAVSVAAERDGQVVAGVVLNVATGVEYAATRGGGATRDGSPLKVREAVPLAQRLVLTGFSYQVERRRIQGKAVARLLTRVRDIRRHGSCALELCHVAEGAADGYVEEGVNIWDYAAGSLVATESGAIVRILAGVTGAELVLAAPAEGYDELAETVRWAGFVSSVTVPRSE
jgi:myo-inositol-1(or 4)-monophosphatase